MKDTSKSSWKPIQDSLTKKMPIQRKPKVPLPRWCQKCHSQSHVDDEGFDLKPEKDL